MKSELAYVANLLLSLQPDTPTPAVYVMDIPTLLETVMDLTDNLRGAVIA